MAGNFRNRVVNSFAPLPAPGIAWRHTSRAALIRLPKGIPSESSARLEVAPVKLFLTYERPSALPAVCAPAHVHHVGRLTVQGVSAGWRGSSVQLASPFQQFIQEESVQLKGSVIRTDGINGSTAKATRMVEAPLTGADTSGVPPRGKPV